MKKIIAVVLAACFAVCTVLSAVCFAVCAEDESTDTMTEREYEERYSMLLGYYRNGEITYDEFVKEVNDLSNEYLNSNSSASEKVVNTINCITNKIGAVVQDYGEAAYQYIADWINDFLDDYEVLETTTNVETYGYNALMITITSNIYRYTYCSYIVVSTDSDGGTKYTTNKNISGTDCYRRTYNSLYDTWTETYNVSRASASTSDTQYKEIKVYGDVRYEDGTQAPTDGDITTTTTSLNFDNVSDQDLVDLINNILEELERQTPDLSTIEGLLRAIYMQTCGINDKMITYDQCNALILSLISSNDENTQDIVNALFEIRDNLKNGGTSDSEDETENEEETDGEDSEEEPPHPDHICGTVYNVKPLDMNWLEKLNTDPSEIKVSYQGNSYFLEPCGCLKLTKDTFLGFGGEDGYYSVDMNYDDYMSIDYDFSNKNIIIDNSKYVDVDFSNYGNMWANLSKSQQNKINSVVELIYKMIEQSVPYSMVTTTLQAFQVVIFNTVSPEDIVLTFDETSINGMTIGGFEVTILSTKFFADEKVSAAMKIVKAFLTVVIGYAWLLSMRKKVTAMMG